MTQLLQQQRRAILHIAAKYGARNVRVFGSAIHTKDCKPNDNDLLIELENGRSLLDQIGFQQELEELLGQPVDVVIEGGISPYLEERILSEAVPL
jgi:predicted nucleotidyltransferase